MKKLFMNLALFAGNTNVTTDSGLTGEMKTWYDKYLITLAEPELVHDQFGQKKPIPKNGGKSIEFRKYSPLPKMLTPLTEGVTPDGQKLSMSTITANVAQYGGYVELSDILLLTAIDNNLVEATELLAGQAGRTLDTVTREVLNGGTNVQYAGGKTARHLLVGGAGSGNSYLSVDEIRKAVRFLKVQNAQRINGDFVAIIHPDCAYDLMNDSKWVNVKTYSDPDGIYFGEIGKIEGVRFVETTEAKVFHSDDLSASSRTLTAAASASSAITSLSVSETLVADALKGRKIVINDIEVTVTGNTTSAVSFASTNFGTITSGTTKVYPGGAGKEGRDVYSTLVLGANAYGVTEIEGGGLRHIVKQLGSAGTADALDQRATAGWKATKVAERLVENYMVRIESCTTFEVGAN